VSGSPVVRNPVSIAGAWITTLAAFSFLGYLTADALGLLESPYSGLLGFAVVPVMFVTGLLLIPFGMWREARRRRLGNPAWRWPDIDLQLRRSRIIIAAVVFLTLVNVVVVAVAGLGVTHYMESTPFCGQVCHEPMQPEFTAHQVSAHSNVTCVQCHVGPGAHGTIKAKMNGMRQMYLYAIGSHNRPIPVPAHGLPVAADTCERCHSPGRPDRDTTRIVRTFADDEANTESTNEVVLHMAKNHWHARKDITVEYVTTDERRETIPYVRVTDGRGQVTEYFAPKTEAPPTGEMRRMDCLDCHTRPAHPFSPTVEYAVDRAMAMGEIPRTLPYAHREAIAALKAEYPDHAAAAAGIQKHLAGFYKDRNDAAVQQAIAGTTRLYTTNVFPSMKITWGTYQSQMGHSQLTGCFRCHDDEHKTRDGKAAIRQDCALCHKEQ
jgi:nitrate/TMAO reductase-like tetraheme cytochrome c subunit